MRWRYLKSSFLWWFGLIWAGVGTPFFFVGLGVLQDSRHFNATAVAATATVVEKGHSTTSKGDSRYWLRYVYRDPAKAEHVATADVSWTVWRRYQDGASLAIRYAPDRPGKSSLNIAEADPWWLLPVIFTGLGTVFGGVGWLLVWRAFAQAGKRIQLLRHGASAMGTVTGLVINTSVTINGRHPRYVTYEFPDDAQVKHQGRSPDLPLRLENRWRTGDPLLVVFDRRDPSRNEADVFDLLEKELPGLRAAR